ncbi:serine/threonine protein kinase, CMGC, CDC2/CDK sub [Boothiomyces sp. JEL0838]|nr:serine/threonine protein kinase, CMGC, CDC2/CDK sub [Boothiomyces sp. JEL0838]
MQTSENNQPQEQELEKENELNERRDGKRKREDDNSESESDQEELPLAPRAPHQGYNEEQANLEIEEFSNSQMTTNASIPASPPYSPRRVYSGCSTIGNYLIQKKIGEGTFGEVSLGVHKTTQKRVALKRVIIHNEREGMPITALREIRILKRLNHPNIIKLEEMAVKPGNRETNVRGATFMVFPYMEHDLDGILQNPLIRLTPAQVKSYMQQLLRGVEHLHKNLILHRDMKCANILVNNFGVLKIADFGLARPFSKEHGQYTNMVITRWFRPPELLMGATEYDAAVDMWGVGCVFGEILKRRAILPGKSDLDQLDMIWNLLGTPNEQNWPGKSYLKLPIFTEGVLKDFDASNYRKKTLPEKFPAHHFRASTYNLLDDLLRLRPEDRLSATEALKADYFHTHPLPAVPGSKDFNVFADSHELDSRKAKISRFEGGSTKAFHLPNHHDVISDYKQRPFQRNEPPRKHFKSYYN